MSIDKGNDMLGASRSLIENEWEWLVRMDWRSVTDDDFFQPWHASHLVERCPSLGHLRVYLRALASLLRQGTKTYGRTLRSWRSKPFAELRGPSVTVKSGRAFRVVSR